MELDLNIILGGPALLAGTGLLLWFFSAPLQIPGFFFPLSLVLLVFGAWFLLKYLKDRGTLYEPRVYPFLDQSASRIVISAVGAKKKTEVVSVESLQEKISVGPNVNDAVVNIEKPKPEKPFSLEEWLRQISQTTVREPEKPSVETVVEPLRDDSQAVYKEVESKIAEASFPSTARLLEKPTREQLAALKKKLAIEEGSLQFKDGSVYLVTSDKEAKRHIWKRLGRWRELVKSLTIAQP